MSHERIVVVSGAAAGSTFEVDHEFVVGRGESGMGNLRGDSEISRRHARFYRDENGRLLIEDLGSTNGTLVNGGTITGPRLLAAGDEVQLGGTMLRYEAAAAQVGETVIGARPEGAAAAPPPPVTPSAAPAPQPAAAARPESGARRRALPAVIAVLLVAAALVGAYVVGKNNGDSTTTTSAAAPATGAGSASGAAGMVYTESNGAAGNSVIAFARASNGRLTQVQSIPTGGKGGLQPQPGCDPPGGCPILDTQGEVALTKDGKLVFAVNAGSNTVTSFRVTSSGLERGSTVKSGGVFPNSLTVHGNLLYVLNSNSLNIAGYTFSAAGAMAPIAGSNQPLVGGKVPTLARQVGFDNTGSTLVVSLFGNPMKPAGAKSLNTFPVSASGAAGAGTAYDASSALPFGFAFDPINNNLVVSQVTELTPGAGQTGSYGLSGGALKAISTQPSGGTAPCWVVITKDGKFVFVVNTGGGAPGGSSVARYSLAADGTLTELGVNSQSSSEFAKTDAVLSKDDKYLYVLNPFVMGQDKSRIDEYTVTSSGDLKLMGQTPSNMPVGVSGLAGY